MSRAAHPARSLDFLSRLHDGELSAADRAHFESHRAHCAECRRAAAEFEEALASYRTAGTPPPASDLAARILRRLETATPRRRPFGVVFGIDLKWAGAFTAAIVAVILGYAIAGRPERSRQIRVSFATTPPAAPAIPVATPATQAEGGAVLPR
ncbi:MAG: anti-sigma factor family protein, partial [Thermoanaerobaculia bacterium]